jgi:geranylgeranyl pyrophosphate synthase
MNLQTILVSDGLHSADNMNEKDLLLIGDLVQQSLLDPLEDFFRHPGKNLRAQLVEIGFCLALRKERELSRKEYGQIQRASSIIEAIHNGALIVDDIQDGSVVRRKEPTLHLKYGMPTALNAGNWLYFWALEQINSLNLSDIQLQSISHNCFKHLARAHVGQALDVGTSINNIPQRRIRSVCLASMELKTGTLMSLAFMMGGILGSASKKRLMELERWGSQLGLVLQMYDDLGNFFQEKGGPEKQWEDLRNLRPSWIWSIASSFSAKDFKTFKCAVAALPDMRLINQWVEDHDFRQACLSRTEPFLRELLEEYEERLESTHPQTLKLLKNIAEVLENAYVDQN